MSIMDRLREAGDRWRGFAYPSDADLAPWRACRTLADVGVVTADWLEGKLSNQPWYAGVAGEDLERDDCYPAMLAGLLAVNRSGVAVTHDSQPGCAGVTGYDGLPVDTRAYVDVLTDEPEPVLAKAKDAGLEVWAWAPGEHRRPRVGGPGRVTVTRCWREGRELRADSAGGHAMPASYVRDCWSDVGGAKHPAVRAVTGAWQIQLVDMDWGRNDRLWPLLARLGGS